MKQFYKSKSFIILISFALVLTIVPSIFALKGNTTVKNIFTTIFSPLQTSCYYLTEKANGLKGYISDFDEIKKENEALKDENARLEKELSEIEKHEADYDWLIDYLDIKKEHTEYKLLDVSISSKSASNYLNTFNINKGSNSGIKEGMPVITNLGLVGKITAVGENWATVSTVYSTSLGGYVEGTDIIGIIKTDYPVTKTCKITYLPLDANVHIGDKILTTGNGDVFPKDILIGKVSSIETDNYSQSITAEINLANDFEEIKNMMVILSSSIILEEGDVKWKRK